MINTDHIKAVYIYTDGSCKGNPGPGGWAYAIYNILNLTTPIHQDSGAVEKTTNNKMEMQAVIEALKVIPKGLDLLTKVHSGSQLIVLTMRGQYKKNKNKKLWNEIEKEIKGKSIIFNWVAGHSGTPQNEYVDGLAQKAAQDKKQEMLDCR